MKKLIALTLAGIMLFALCACGSTGTTSGDVSYDIPEGKQIPDDAVLDITIASHPSWPYQENWALITRASDPSASIFIKSTGESIMLSAATALIKTVFASEWLLVFALFLPERE